MDTLQIAPPDVKTMQEAQDILASLDIPHDGLGRLPTLSIRLAGMTCNTRWYPGKRAALIFAGDHHTQVEQYPYTSAERVQLMLDQKSSVNSLARQMGIRLVVVDAGVDYQFKPKPRSLTPPIGIEMTIPTFIQRKISMGVGDLTQGNTMTAEQAQKAIELGKSVVQEEQKRGLDLLFIGDIGVGNRVSATAIVTAITGKRINTDGQIMTIVENALTHHAPANEQTLMKLAGFEMGAIAGAILYAASQKIPIVIDGLATTASALLAYQMDPNIQHYLIAGHKSDTDGHHFALGYLGLDPLLDMGISMGEGVGALLAYPLIESAMRILNEVGKRKS